MRKLVIVSLAVVAAIVVIPASATAVGPTDGEIDISGAELAGSTSGTADVNVFGTVRCAAAGPLVLDVQLFQESTDGVGSGGSIGHTCPAPGDLVKWVVTANGGPFMVGDKVTIFAEAAIADEEPFATDMEDHVLRWGR